MINNHADNMYAAKHYCAGPIWNVELAKAYVPYQSLMCLYPPMKGLNQGTIFPELDRPYGSDPEYTVDA